MIAVKISKTICFSLAIVLVLQLTACGTLFYPERKGQEGGRIDPLVAATNCVGLLFFLIPGIIAFAVDFTTGAIYLPGGTQSNLTPSELQSVTVNGKVDSQRLNSLLTKKLGHIINIEAATIQLQRFDSEAALLAYFAATKTQFAGL